MAPNNFLGSKNTIFGKFTRWVLEPPLAPKTVFATIFSGWLQNHIIILTSKTHNFGEFASWVLEPSLAPKTVFATIFSGWLQNHIFLLQRHKILGNMLAGFWSHRWLQKGWAQKHIHVILFWIQNATF